MRVLPVHLTIEVPTVLLGGDWNLANCSLQSEALATTLEMLVIKFIYISNF